MKRKDSWEESSSSALFMKGEEGWIEETNEQTELSLRSRRVAMQLKIDDEGAASGQQHRPTPLPPLRNPRPSRGEEREPKS